MESLFGNVTWYSRAGRMLAPGIKVAVHGSSKNNNSKSSSTSAATAAVSRIDFSKMAPEEIADDEEDEEVQPAAVAGSTLCSSPRQHPNSLIKRQQVQNQEKELHFRNALQSVIISPEVSESTKVNHVATLREEARLLSERDYKQVRPNAAFLAVPRDKVVSERLLQGPPVGIYRPRYQAVEEALHVAKFPSRHHNTSPRPKHARTPPPAAAAGAHATPAPSLQTDVTLNATFSETMHSTSLGKTIHTIADVITPLPKPSWPFASKTKGHELQINQSYSTTPVVPFVNSSLVDNFSGTKLTCIMDKHVGRRDEPTTQVHDLSYDVSRAIAFKAKTPTVFIDRQPPRDKPEHVPRTSATVPRAMVPVDLDSADKVKFKRLPDIAFDKGSPRKNDWLALRSPTQDTYGAPAPTSPSGALDSSFSDPVGPAVRTVDLSRGSPPPKQHQVVDIMYDVDRSAIDKHTPTALIKEDIYQKREVANSASELRSYSVELLHKKVVHNVSIAGMASRDQHSKSGRMSPSMLVEAQQKFYNTEVVEPVHGSPKIALLMSRDKRAKVILPAQKFVDKVYDYKVDAGRAAIAKGNVTFDRTLDREHRAPSRADLM